MQVIVLYIIIIFLFGLFKKVNLYESFSIGVEDSYSSLLKMFPSMLGIVLVLNVFLNSGIVEKMHLCGVEKFFCPELIIQMLTKPISWSSSLLTMTSIYKKYGVDSFYGKYATLIQNSFDTTFYVVITYLSALKSSKNSKILIPLFLANLLTYLFIAIIMRVL